MYKILIFLFLTVTFKNVIADDDFTSWMKKSDLDNYFEVLNNFDEGNDFFAKGHWITAVEGRWHEANFEYRVKYANTPSNAYYWYWFLNQDFESFSAKLQKYNQDGFRLVYAQSFNSSTGELRYQGVWHKDDFE